jgi:glycerophosphoryl diester phosphodiesterase
VIALRLVVMMCALAVSTAGAFDVQGHRGARGLAPENTLAAFQRAIDVGVTTIETDLGITRDGVVVIAHDRRLNAALTRGADGKWLTATGPAISSLTLAELAAYDVGRLDPASSYAKNFPHQVAADGERIPTLDALIALVKRSGRSVRLNVETKLSPNAPEETRDPASFARAVVDTLRKAEFIERTTLQSFDWRTLVEAKKLAPALRTACLTTEGGSGDTVKPGEAGVSPWHAGLSLVQHGGSVPALVKAANCDIWSPFFRNLTPERLREARALGLVVLPWTVNERADMESLIDTGVDGIITDYPDRLVEALRSKKIAPR